MPTTQNTEPSKPRTIKNAKLEKDPKTQNPRQSATVLTYISKISKCVDVNSFMCLDCISFIWCRWMCSESRNPRIGQKLVYMKSVFTFPSNFAV